MAETKDSKPKVNSGNLKPVTTRYPLVGGGRGRTHICLLRPSGRTTLNVAASKALDEHALAASLDLEKYLTTFAVDPDKGLIAIYVSGADAEGAMPVRRNKKTHVLTVHLGGAFLEHPILKPTVPVHCLVYPDKDSKDKPTLWVALHSALVVRRTPRNFAAAAPDLTTPTQTPSGGSGESAE